VGVNLVGVNQAYLNILRGQALIADLYDRVGLYRVHPDISF